MLAEYEQLLLGIDPAMPLTYRQEYANALGSKIAPEVLILQEWLIACLVTLTHFRLSVTESGYRLLSQCTETTSAPGSPIE